MAPDGEQEEKDDGPDYFEYTEGEAKIFDLFEEYGAKTKDEADAEPEKYHKEVFYDFTPYNAKDPVLLSLMTAVKY